MNPDAVQQLPRTLLRLEGLAVGAGATVVYFDAGHPWWLFVVLILAPDLSALGYLTGESTGAVTYNLAHTYVWPVALAVIGIVAQVDLATELALIWAAHIGFDRALGYGLKYPSGFKDTHLQRI
jgi:hypothetical protein